MREGGHLCRCPTRDLISYFQGEVPAIVYHTGNTNGQAQHASQQALFLRAGFGIDGTLLSTACTSEESAPHRPLPSGFQSNKTLGTPGYEA